MMPDDDWRALQLQLRSIERRLDALSGHGVPNQNTSTTSTPTFAGLSLSSVGVWTPAWVGSTGAGAYTYTNQAGNYVQVGTLVFFTGRMTISAIGTPPTGNMTISGLPFTSGSQQRGTVTFGRISQLDFNAADIHLTGFVNSANTNIALETVRDNGAAVAYPAATFTNVACDVIFSGFYMT